MMFISKKMLLLKVVGNLVSVYGFSQKYRNLLILLNTLVSE